MISDDTIVPRLIRAEANLDNIHIINGMEVNGTKRAFDPSTDMPHVMKLAETIGNVALITHRPCSSNNRAHRRR